MTNPATPKGSATNIRIMLDEDSVAPLRALAREKGVRPGALARMWVREEVARCKQERENKAAL